MCMTSPLSTAPRLLPPRQHPPTDAGTMSEKPPSPRPPRPGPATDPPPGQPGPQQSVRVGSPAAVLSVVPHLLGFVPSKSLIVIGAGPPLGRIHLTLRFDLPDPPSTRVARDITQHAVSVLTGQRQALAVAIGYGPGHLVTPFADAMRKAAGRANLELRDMLRVEGGRYWSYLCRNPACCPPQGVPLDPRHPAGAAMDAAGMPVLPDRAALAASIGPLGGITRTSMRDATRRAETHAVSLLSQASRPGSRPSPSAPRPRPRPSRCRAWCRCRRRSPCRRRSRRR